MKLEKEFTINSIIVDEVFNQGKISVYEKRGGNLSKTVIYFVNNETQEVIFTQSIEACEGYISHIQFLV